MSAELAKKYYTEKDNTKKLNCAQSVTKAFQGFAKISDEEINGLVKCGGGRSPEGLCGALYAAKVIFDKIDKEEFEKARKIFIVAAGSDKCREIRSINKCTCLECVVVAAKYIENYEKKVYEVK